MVEASIGEFLNLQNGIFLVNMSNAGIDLELTLQEVHHYIKLNNVYRAAVDLSFGRIDILIIEE